VARLISNRSAEERVDLLVVGSGIAGLIAALTVAEHGGRVLVVSKGSLSASASYHAQGGIAAAGSKGDSPELHAADTIAAGRGLCRSSAVEVLVEEAPVRIDDLRALGVRFSPELGLEEVTRARGCFIPVAPRPDVRSSSRSPAAFATKIEFAFSRASECWVSGARAVAASG